MFTYSSRRISQFALNPGGDFRELKTLKTILGLSPGDCGFTGPESKRYKKRRQDLSTFFWWGYYRNSCHSSENTCPDFESRKDVFCCSETKLYRETPTKPTVSWRQEYVNRGKNHTDVFSVRNRYKTTGKLILWYISHFWSPDRHRILKDSALKAASISWNSHTL
jgi:hypothetical protein